MAEEERGHRHRLLEMYEAAFRGASAADPPRGRKGFLKRRPIWLTKNLPLDTIRKEVETWRCRPSSSTSRPPRRPRMSACAGAWRPRRRGKGHENLAAKLTDRILSPDVRAEEDKTRRRVFVLQYVQPGLAGLMDGSVLDAGAVVRRGVCDAIRNWQTFLVGLAASIGAGISMGFAEALSDDGALSGRGSPWLRGCCQRHHDGAWRARPHHALPGSGFMGERVLDRDRDRGRRRVSSNYGRSPSFARNTWTRRSFKPHSRSCSAA